MLPNQFGSKNTATLSLNDNYRSNVGIKVSLPKNKKQKNNRIETEPDQSEVI